MNLARRVINKISRIVRGPQVRDRIVVKVVDASKRKSLKPGFLIGVYRSGTTLLRYVLDSHSKITVPPETNYRMITYCKSKLLNPVRAITASGMPIRLQRQKK